VGTAGDIAGEPEARTQRHKAEVLPMGDAEVAIFVQRLAVFVVHWFRVALQTRCHEMGRSCSYTPPLLIL
jgi:hypothetical protein